MAQKKTATKKGSTAKRRTSKTPQTESWLRQLNQDNVTTGDMKGTALETLKMLLLGTIGGGLIGAMIGKPSFLAGLAATGAGQYTGNRILTLLGMGMMASNGFAKSGSVSGLEGLDGVKERVMAFKEDLMDKTYVNKLLKKAGGGTSAAAARQVGELQYFNYANEMAGHSAALASIEDQLLESGMNFHNANNGAFAPAGMDDEFDDERLF
jgi:hypothetical protein